MNRHDFYRFFRPAVLGLALVLLVPGMAVAGTKIAFDGQVRLRSEVDSKRFAPESHVLNFSDLRTRLGVRVDPSDRVYAYIQFQDSRRIGGFGSGNLESFDNVDLHQAYFAVSGVIHSKLRIKGGRFELNYGNQRVFGSVGWNNVGRSWEGGIISYVDPAARVDVFELKRLELSDSSYNRDFDIIGLYISTTRAGLDLFGFYELDADSTGYVRERLKRGNIGTYFSRATDQWAFTVQGVYQFGKQVPEMLPSTLVQDISAFMIAAEAGYTFDERAQPHIAAGIDVSSGDNGSADDKFTAYSNSYYTSHSFRGAMDYFAGDPVIGGIAQPVGLIDLYLNSSLTFVPDWQFALAAHLFKTHKEYLSLVDGNGTKEVGGEIDLTVVNTQIYGAKFTAGMSAFFPSEDFAGTNADPGLWGYLMTTVDF
jgi:hypothetical protein